MMLLLFGICSVRQMVNKSFDIATLFEIIRRNDQLDPEKMKGDVIVAYKEGKQCKLKAWSESSASKTVATSTILGTETWPCSCESRPSGTGKTTPSAVLFLPILEQQYIISPRYRGFGTPNTELLVSGVAVYKAS